MPLCVAALVFVLARAGPAHHAIACGAPVVGGAAAAGDEIAPEAHQLPGVRFATPVARDHVLLTIGLGSFSVRRLFHHVVRWNNTVPRRTWLALEVIAGHPLGGGGGEFRPHSCEEGRRDLRGARLHWLELSPPQPPLLLLLLDLQLRLSLDGFPSLVVDPLPLLLGEGGLRVEGVPSCHGLILGSVPGLRLLRRLLLAVRGDYGDVNRHGGLGDRRR